MRFDDEAFKHGKNRQDIEFLYASYLTEWFDNGISTRGNERAMLVGFDKDGMPTEVGLELITGKDGYENSNKQRSEERRVSRDEQSVSTAEEPTEEATERC